MFGLHVVVPEYPAQKPAAQYGKRHLSIQGARGPIIIMSFTAIAAYYHNSIENMLFLIRLIKDRILICDLLSQVSVESKPLEYLV